MTTIEAAVESLKAQIDDNIDLDTIYSEISFLDLSDSDKKRVKSIAMSYHSEKLKSDIKRSNQKMLSFIILSLALCSLFLLLIVWKKTSPLYLGVYAIVIAVIIRRVKVLAGQSIYNQPEKRNKNTVFHKGLFKKF